MRTLSVEVVLAFRPDWILSLDQVHSSYLILATLAALGAAIGGLFQIGLLGWLFRVFGVVLRGGIGKGFLVWERLLAWASWPVFMALVLGFLVTGGAVGSLFPILRILCGLLPLLMGATACLAYMFIDTERYEVERGYKAVHNPLQGQELAVNLARYGQQVHAPLLIGAAIGVIGGFALLNQGLYETIGKEWYRVEGVPSGPIYADFLTYALINLLGIVDVLDLAQSQHLMRFNYIHPIRWPASTLLSGFKSFFVLVLLQQIFASLRQGKLLAETITDFWSPHEPIHDRARNALPQYGVVAIGPLLTSLCAVPTLTKEQRERLPLIVTLIGPSTIPILVRHLHNAHEHARAIAVAALGQLHAVDKVPLLVALGADPSALVRLSLVEALGILGRAGTQPRRKKRGFGRAFGSRGFGLAWLFGWKKRGAPVPHSDPVGLAVATLATALADNSTAVRTQAARSLGLIGPTAAAVAPGLIALLKDADETVRCEAAAALGRVVGEGATPRTGAGAGDPALACAALIELLQDASAPVKAAAAQALGALKEAASSAVPFLIPLLQDREEAVRTAAAAAITQVGPLSAAATNNLVEGLTSRDTVVRAQTAEALGNIGVTAEDAAPALVAAMKDGNDRVRAKAVEALGKIGEAAAEAAVPGLVRALRDQDNWVSALAAEALGQMGESADGAIPALVRSLGHLNPQVRANAAAALGKMGLSAAAARPALEKAFQDDDGGVRSQAIRALGTIGSPTTATKQIVRMAFQDGDPLVRAAAVEAVGQWGEPDETVLDSLVLLLEDANDQVKVEAAKVLPRLATATPAVLDALCRRLLDDDSAWVQLHAAQALGKFGSAATAAGGPLLRAVQTGEESVREQALRALAMIQPPEIVQAFAVGLKDSNGDIRKIASGGWMKAAAIPEEVIPALVEALHDPETQVRANAAHALGRLDTLPAAAVPLLLDCTTHPSDGLRMNAALALKLAPGNTVEEAMHHLLDDPNLRIRLIAASAVLPVDPGNAQAATVLEEALNDPALRVRKAALELVDALGPAGQPFLERLKQRAGLEEDEDLRNLLGKLIERLDQPAEVNPPLFSG